MSTNGFEAPDPEDMFADTRMSFGDHIEELRTHLIRALKGFVVGMAISIWPLGSFVLGIIVDPVQEQLKKFELRKIRKDIEKSETRKESLRYAITPVEMKLRFRRDQLPFAPGEKANTEPVAETTVRAFEKLLMDLQIYEVLEKDNRNHGNYLELDVQVVNPVDVVKRTLEAEKYIVEKPVSTMGITEAFFVYFKVAMMTGLVISSPWVFYQIWAFVAAGLYPNEKRIVHVYLPFSLFLFISGVLICQFFVMPRAVEAMLWFNEWLDLGVDLRLNEWLGFALMMPLVFGISFQTPLVMMFAHRIGLISVHTYREKRRIAWFAMAVFAAIITPSVDAFSMMFLWVPMGGLYELGILLCVFQGEQEQLAEWEEEERRNELVEV